MSINSNSGKLCFVWFNNNYIWTTISYLMPRQHISVYTCSFDHLPSLQLDCLFIFDNHSYREYGGSTYVYHKNYQTVLFDWNNSVLFLFFFIWFDISFVVIFVSCDFQWKFCIWFYSIWFCFVLLYFDLILVTMTFRPHSHTHKWYFDVCYTHGGE